MKRVAIALLSLLIFCSDGLPQTSAESKVPATIQEKTAGMQKFPGYFPFYWEAESGKIWLEIDKWDSEFLYVVSLAAGVGSHGIIGLDRGQLRRQRVVTFQRVGPKVLLVQPNLRFRAISDYLRSRSMMMNRFPLTNPSKGSVRFRAICIIHSVFGFGVAPAKYTRRVESSMTSRT